MHRVCGVKDRHDLDRGRDFTVWAGTWTIIHIAGRVQPSPGIFFERLQVGRFWHYADAFDKRNDLQSGFLLGRSCGTEFKQSNQFRFLLCVFFQLYMLQTNYSVQA